MTHQTGPDTWRGRSCSSDLEHGGMAVSAFLVGAVGG
jgi:hypothetical protein